MDEEGNTKPNLAKIRAAHQEAERAARIEQGKQIAAIHSRLVEIENVFNLRLMELELTLQQLTSDVHGLVDRLQGALEGPSR